MTDPSHEPQKVAQASCLFGADRLEACPTLQPAAWFMAPTRGGKTVGASHDLRPLTPSLSPNGGEGGRRPGEGDSRFMAPTHVRFLEVFPFHEPLPGASQFL